MGPTETLANYAVEAKFRDFPEEVVQRVKWLILDEIGCGLGGAQTDVGKRHIEVAKYLSDKTESTIIGDGIKVSCLNAVLCNTDLCNVLDYDDTFMYVPSHPGGPVILPALAVAEMVGSSAEEVMSAIIVGYEVSLRVARAIRCTYVNPEGKRDVFMTTSWYLFGPPVVVARLLGMTKSEVINALGIAGGQPLGWRGRYSFSRGGSSLKGVGDIKYYQGLAAFLGTLAALRAYKGVTGPEDILDGERFWQGTGANNCNYLELTMDLGEKYRLMEVGFKHTPSCRWTHAPLTAVEDALKGENLAPGDIEEIVLIGTPRLMNYEWETMMDAEFSIPCIVAMDIAGGEPGPTWYTPDLFFQRN